MANAALHVARTGLDAQNTRMRVIANNLANASTRGFKAETAFARLMDNQLAKTDTALDLTAGSLTETHNSLDLAVEGDGFFVTQTPNGERFVRNGSFRLDAERLAHRSDARAHVVDELGEGLCRAHPPPILGRAKDRVPRSSARTVGTPG